MTYPEQPGNWSDPTNPVPPNYPVSPVQDGATQPYPSYDTPPAQPPQQQYPPQYAQQYPPQAGYAGYGGYGQPMVVGAPTNGMAIAALVCSLLGLVTGITAPVGAILGHIARKQIKQTGEQGDGMALAGIIVGWVVTGLVVLCCGGYLIMVAGVFGLAATQSPNGFGS